MIFSLSVNGCQLLVIGGASHEQLNAQWTIRQHPHKVFMALVVVIDLDKILHLALAILSDVLVETTIHIH
jgi:hypothetical protein